MSRPASDEKSTDPVVDYKTILNSLANLNVPGDKNWCSKPGTGNTFYSCVPEILLTKDESEPFRCLRKIGNEHGVIGSGAFGEVMKYQRKNRGQTEEIAIKVLAQKGFSECQDNPPYYTPEECNPYLVLQRCITPVSFKCYETKLEVKVLAMEPMETTLDEFLTKYTDFGEEETEITLTFKDKRKILEKIWKALKCVWEHGGVYTDMKGANVGVNPNSENLGESVIKLIDLGSICKRGTQPMNYTFVPPQK
jgi:serine/threonine protein kinase